MSHGFELLREQKIPELNSTAKLYRHIKTGAELLSIENDDENKCFGITFTTPPEDNTGLPHILEHSVLCGSRKYPVKDPFVQLLKGSLATFVNAMTFSDKTMYPVASQNLADFYNLIDVYLDAVFYPNISPEVLKQEGWHYELENPDAPLTYKGIVFNEMKGAYSSPDDLLGRESQISIFPDTVYGVDSGGDPASIPDLTYEQFKAFYDRYYHPSNARIYFYGDDDPEERLRIINDYLKDFDRLDVNAKIELQAKFDEPRRIVKNYAASEDNKNKAYITLNWLLPETHNTQLVLAFQILEHILVGTPASPLEKALLESGLGEDVIGSLDSNIRQMMFTLGMKGVDTHNVDQVEHLILQTLQSLADSGIDPKTVQASLNTIEFQLREFNTGGFPRGLVILIMAFNTWLYDGDPIEALRFEAPLQAIKEQVASGEKLFESLIREHLLDNPHRTTVILEPDTQLSQKLEAEERARLDAIRATLNENDIQRIIQETIQLRELQNTPDSPEALATLPSLTLDDLDKKNKIIPLEELTLADVPVLYHDLFTNGIVYLDLGFNLKTLPQDLLPYYALFEALLFQTGTHHEDYVSLIQRIGQKTGGIYATTFLSERRTGTGTESWLFLRGKSTLEQVNDLLEIIRDVLFEIDLKDQERFRQIILTEKAKLEASIIPGGHQFVARRLAAHFTPSGWLAEQLSGLDYLFFIRQITNEFEQNWDQIVHKLETVRQTLVNRQAIICNVTLAADDWKTVEPRLKTFLEAFPKQAFTPTVWQPQYITHHEGLLIPAQVNYVGKGANLFDLGYTLHGSAQVISRYLNTTWLWNQIRVMGGAYGAFGLFDATSGVFRFVSYRDPNLLQTLNVYDQTADFLKALEIDQAELTKAIIGAIGQMDTYQLPDAKGYSSLLRYLIGYTDELRQQTRDEVLSTTLKDFHTFGDVLEAMKPSGHVVVIGSQNAIEATNTTYPGLLNPLKIL